MKTGSILRSWLNRPNIPTITSNDVPNFDNLKREVISHKRFLHLLQMGKRIANEVVNIIIAPIGVKLLPLSIIKICANLTPNKIDNFLCPPNGQVPPGRVSVFAVHNVFQVLATLGFLLPCHLDKYLRF